MSGTAEVVFHGARWWAVYTNSRQKKTAAAMLQMFGVYFRLARPSEFRQKGGRRQALRLPLFNSCFFVQKPEDDHLQPSRTREVVGVFGNYSGSLPHLHQQIREDWMALFGATDSAVGRIAGVGDSVRVARASLTGLRVWLLHTHTSIPLISIHVSQRPSAASLSNRDVLLVDRSAARLGELNLPLTQAR